MWPQVVRLVVNDENVSASYSVSLPIRIQADVAASHLTSFMGTGEASTRLLKYGPPKLRMFVTKEQRKRRCTAPLPLNFRN
jgi:hypothetical protein